ncbi:TPA: olxA [Enterobacter hormaechei subsp. xiangfangensis]|nr:olxA [Enterobacter hormaechei subsp. xiangfangensis]HAV1890593.1 olxA [Enterobacter hormaechei subsp. xiangfangensis]
MATLIDTIQPPEEHIEKILTMARGVLSEDAWVSQMSSVIVDNLTRNPALYAAFGPWWYAVKNILLAKGYDNFGILIQSDVFSIYQMNRDALTLCAAVLYQDTRTDEGIVYSREHVLEVNENADDSEPYTFVLEDDEVNRLIQQRGNLNGNTNQTP